MRVGRVVLGVTGGIAAYKSAELLRILRKKGMDVRVVMTRNASRFVGPVTFQALSGHPVFMEMFGPDAGSHLEHVELADWTDLFIVAPATANILGKFAAGIADDFLSTFYLALDASVIIAPAMNPRMYSHPATRRSVELLKERGHIFIGPDTGDTACGRSGPGRMSAPEIIAEHAAALLGRSGDLAGIRMLITAGPTREMIDPVRYLGNRSSGLMGYSLAEAAVERGALVTLISGPVALRSHACIETVSVNSAAEMFQAVRARFPHADILILAAAVVDWRPRLRLDSKWKKGGSEAVLELAVNEDIAGYAGEVKNQVQLVAGFAAETEDLIENARKKLHAKKLDFIVANDVSRIDSGFESETNSGFILDPSGAVIELPVDTKRNIADRILDEALRGFISIRGNAEVR
ncbi:bifunctional phosphopantothenoylcysteine decarboxylase/phosphopantothenate--cysteine ligase CoaBC [bacterium]|nr:bifunctional phosphopantothenoylcysteine decarboxylase/phosphopantothenate--cysteine ligase CoaBC [candidate division CSSED10-310 bacterium]